MRCFYAKRYKEFEMHWWREILNNHQYFSRTNISPCRAHWLFEVVHFSSLYFLYNINSIKTNVFK